MGRTSLTLALLALVARGVAFVGPIVIAGWFGVAAETDAFYYALAVPAFVVILFNSTVATLLVPAFARVRVTDPGRLGPLSVTAAGMSALAGAAIGVGSALLLPAAMPVFSGFDPGLHDEVRYHAWALAPFQLVLGAGTALRAGLEVDGAFVPSALSPAIRATVQLALTGALLGWGVRVLPLGVFAGASAELAWLAGVLLLRGHSLRPEAGLVPDIWADLGGLGPVVLGEAFVALQILVDKAFASGLGTGAVTVLEYADRLRLIPQTLLETSLVVVAYNTWARLEAEARPEERARSVARSLVWVALLAPPILGGMAVARLPLVRFVYERGAFGPEWSPPTATALAGFIPGIWFSLLGALLVKAQLLAGRRALVFWFGLASIVAKLALNLALRPLGVLGLTLSTSVSAAVITLCSALILRPALSPRHLLEVGLLLGLTGAGVALLGDAVGPELWSPETILVLLPFLGLLGLGAWRARAA